MNQQRNISSEVDIKLNCSECNGDLFQGICLDCGLEQDEYWTESQWSKIQRPGAVFPKMTNKYVEWQGLDKKWKRMRVLEKRKTYVSSAEHYARERISLFSPPSPVFEEAVMNYRKAVKKGLMVGKDSSHYIAGVYIVAARNYGLPVLFEDLENFFPGGKSRKHYIKIMDAIQAMGPKLNQVSLNRLIVRIYEGHVDFPLVVKAINNIKIVIKKMPSATPRVKVAVAGRLAGIENSAELSGILQVTLDKYITRFDFLKEIRV